MLTTAGSIVVNDLLPEDLRDDSRVLNAKALESLLREVAQRHPDRYRDVSHGLLRVAATASQRSGGFSFGLEDLRRPQETAAIRDRVRQAVDAVLADPKLQDNDRDRRIVQILEKALGEQQEAAYNAAVKSRNPLADQVVSGARGNKANLSALLGSDLLYTDAKDRRIPVPVLHSYSEGLTLPEMWAGAYGARKGVVSVKMCLAGDTDVLMSD